MEKRTLGKTNLEVSIIGYGAGHIGGNELTEKEVEFLLNSVLDEGINLIDTARAYGLSEERIGRYLAHRKQEFLISTKVGYGVEGFTDWTYDCITHGVERALRILRVDVLDIVHLHSCPRTTLEQGEVILALEKAKDQGKVRAIAYSGENEALLYALESQRFDSVMTSINFCDQHSARSILPEFQSSNIGIIAKRPIANAPWRFSERPIGDYAEEYWHRWKTLNIDPSPLGWSEFALRFTASVTGVSSLIAGTRNLSHLRENIRLLNKGSLPKELFDQALQAFDRWGENWKGEI